MNPTQIKIIRDSKGHLYLATTPNKFRPHGITYRRCDEHGQPLIRLRGLSKKNKRILRAVGITASKWVQTNQNHA